LSSENWQHITSVLLQGYVVQTTLLCVGVGFISLVFGTASAWCVTQFSFRGHRFVEWAMILPLAMPAYISAYAYGWFFDHAGPVQNGLAILGITSQQDVFLNMRSLGGAIWILGLATTPYVYMLARTAFVMQPHEWWEAASTLGASSWRFFFRIVFPAARPFILTGVALALMETIADIGTVNILGVQTLSSGIYRIWFFMNEPVLAMRIAGLLLIFVFVLLFMEAMGRRGMKYSSERPIARFEKTRLVGLSSISVSCICLLPVIAGFFLPLGVILRLFSYSSFSSILPSVTDHSLQTIQLAIIAALITGTAAFLMVLAERFNRGWLRFITLFANLGYAIPGAVLAVSLIMLFGWIRDAWNLHIAITGSILGLLIAYMVRFMATAYTSLHNGMLRIPHELDMVSFSLGKGRLSTIVKIHIPLLSLPLCMALLMVFLDVVKELPATLILRPFDIQPLAILV
jgi:iron(III) transport system permease protein